MSDEEHGNMACPSCVKIQLCVFVSVFCLCICIRIFNCICICICISLFGSIFLCKGMSDEECGNMACPSCVKIPLPVSQQAPKARNHGDYLAFPDVKITGNHLERTWIMGRAMKCSFIQSRQLPRSRKHKPCYPLEPLSNNSHRLFNKWQRAEKIFTFIRFQRPLEQIYPDQGRIFCDHILLLGIGWTGRECLTGISLWWRLIHKTVTGHQRLVLEGPRGAMAGK